ncbi:MAG: RHS repeat protein, partial [Blastocatellia bacterium]|nr:RHS repeat protein [Blastocatellia bacterium]
MLGRPLIVTHDDGAFATGTPYPLTTREYTYTDPANPYYVASVKDDRNNYTTYQRYPATHRIMQIDHPDGGTETFDYNPFGQVTRHKRQNDAYEFYDYDGTGLLTTIWNPVPGAQHPTGNLKITYSYYTGTHPWRDRVQMVTDARGYKTVYEYDKTFDSNGDQTSTPCPGRGLITKVSYLDDTHGGTIAGGTSMSYVYDIYGNLLRETQDQLAETTTYTYDEYNRLKTMKVPPSDAIPSQRATVYDYTPDRAAPPNDINPLSHTTDSIWKETSPSLVLTSRKFDENFRLISEEIGSQDPEKAATTWFGYDNVGNRIYVTDPRASGADDPVWTTYTLHDTRNRVMQVSTPPAPIYGPERTKYEYDGNNNVTKIVRADTTEVTREYDTMNRLTKDIQPKDPGVTATTMMAYNHAGTLGTVTDARSRVTMFLYNEKDLKKQVIYPPNGQGVSDFEAYEYDQNYNLINRRATSNVYQVFKYDERNRQMRMSWHDGKTVDTTPHQWANGFYDNTYAYDAAGRLTTAANANSTVTRTWDKAGRLLTEKQAYAGATFSAPILKYSYRHDSKVSRLYVGPGETYDFLLGYDGLARLSTLTSNVNTGIDHQYGYDRASNVTSRVNNLNGTNVIYTVDQLNRIAQRDINIPTGTFSREQYGFDARDRVTDVRRDETLTNDHFG